MKPELNSELKQRFFALYWGQKVAFVPFKEPSDQICNVKDRCSYGEIKAEYLLLRPLSSITDTEAIELSKILDPNLSVEDLDSVVTEYKGQLVRSFEEIDFVPAENQISPIRIHFACQYLISKSFAIPYMGHSVAELEKAGWIKFVKE